MIQGQWDLEQSHGYLDSALAEVHLCYQNSLSQLPDLPSTEPITQKRTKNRSSKNVVLNVITGLARYLYDRKKRDLLSTDEKVAFNQMFGFKNNKKVPYNLVFLNSILKQDRLEEAVRKYFGGEIVGSIMQSRCHNEVKQNMLRFLNPLYEAAMKKEITKLI